jgi:ATP-dependent Clp protease ATP-binding subunit ClpC
MCDRFVVYDDFSEDARQLMVAAEETAQIFHHSVIDTEHILLALLRLDESRAVRILHSLDISPYKVDFAVRQMMDSSPDHQPPQQIVLSESAEEVLALSRREGERFGHDEVDTDHILIGLMREDAGVAAQVLVGKFSLEIDTVSGLLMPERAVSEVVHILGRFGRDLVAMAEAGKLDPVIGRAQELTRVLQVLTRRTRIYPLLLGEAGIDKGAVVECLAQAIVHRETPPTLALKRLIAIDGKAFALAGLQDGNVAETLREALLRAVGMGIAIFIDDLPALLGIEKFSFLRAMVMNSDVTFIGTGTPADYGRYVSPDALLRQQFQSIRIAEASVADTVEILKRIPLRAFENNQFRSVSYGDPYHCGGAWSDVAGCFLDELHARGQAEFGVDVGEVGLHGAW